MAALVTDEWFDRWVARPVARVVARGLAPTPVTANQVTVLSAAFGVGAGAALAGGHGVAFAVLIAVMLVLDCADGQLARLRGGGGVWGRVVDGLADYVTAIAVHLGLIAWLARDHGWATALGWGLTAGLSMAWTSYLLDKYKRRYRGDVDDLAGIERARDEARGLRRWLLGRFLPYASGITEGVRIEEPEAYRARLRAAMAIWLWLGPTTRYVLLGVLAALGRPLLYAWVAGLPYAVVALSTLALQRWLEGRPPAVLERG